ncbi:MAG: penicillin-binding protein 2 [Thermoleophilia bacterium]|nr:penicillin-binding protein 2 [Thermoleophilia bacterium]
MGLLVVGVAITGTRAVWLGVIRAPALSAQARDQQERKFEVPAERGDIVDRNGRVLAQDRLTAKITTTPYLIADPEAVARRLAPVLGRPPAELEKALSGGGGYAVLAPLVDQRTATRVRQLQIPNIDVTDTFTRNLPQGMVASQLVGLVGEDDAHKGQIVGQFGLEQRYNAQLTGTPGQREEAHDPLGQTLETIKARDPIPGKTIHTTIDSTIERRTEEILAETRTQHSALSANAVVMRPNGDILAMASVPRTNPNRRDKLNVDLMRNRPVADTIEPGSTFKIVAITGALETDAVKPTTVFDVPAIVELYDRTLKDSHNEGATRWSVSQILQRSSNKGTYLIAKTLGERNFANWIEKFGFGTASGVDVPGEEPGIVPDYTNPEQWSGTSILNLPIGQGLTVNQVQLARAYTAIANGGRLVHPRVVSSVGDTPVPRVAGKRIFSRATARKMDAMLRDAVGVGGTGKAAQVEGYEVAGKTGTANKVDPTTGEYTSRYRASFVGYLPADNPQLIIAVSVDEPQDIIYGGEVAAPAFEKIAEFAVQQLGIPPA